MVRCQAGEGASSTEPPFSSGGKPCRGQRDTVIMDHEPALRGSIRASCLEVRHLPVTNLGRLKIVHADHGADPAALVVDDDLKQAAAQYGVRLLSWLFPSAASRVGCKLRDVFSHGRGLANDRCYWPVATSKITSL